MTGSTDDIPESIRYTADVVCVRHNSVLVIQRGWDPYEGMFALPGGHCDRGETALDAAVRELREETGVSVCADELTLIGVYDKPDRDPRGRYVSVAYLVFVPDDTQAEAGDDAAAVQWMPLPASVDLAFDHSEILADAWRAATALRRAASLTA
jgi:8-oxo-dGTP diphosphatase